MSFPVPKPIYTFLNYVSQLKQIIFQQPSTIFHEYFNLSIPKIRQH